MTSATTTVLADDAGEQTIVDVWSRTSPKYRKRAILLLIVNLLLYAGVSSFAYWVRTGVNFAPAHDDYWHIVAETFMPKGDANLGNFVLFPIRVDQIPLHGVVVGLLLASLVSVPILIAILYRFPCSIPFIFTVAFIAVMPWLAINIAGACMLASLRPFRLRFRYASALLGLMLVLLYFYGASRQATPPVEHYSPADRIKFYAPWILATFASCIIMGVVLYLARLVNYRPGVVTPLLVLSFAVPVVLFEWHIGRDELYYRLLEQRSRDEFNERDGSAWFERITREAWMMRPEPRPTLEAFRTQVDLRLALELDSAAEMRTVFAEQKAQFIDECRAFVRAYPTSRYAPNALYLQGMAQDARIDVAAFQERKLIRAYFDFPVQSPRAHLVWEKVVHNAPDSSISAVGRYKLAILDARAGRTEQAIAWLEDLIARYDPNAKAARAAADPNFGIVKKALSSAPPDAILKIPVDNVLFEGRRLLELLRNNAHDPQYGVRPLCGSLPAEPRQPGFLEIDPHVRHHAENLRAILRAYPRCLLEDNIEVWLARLEEDLDERIFQLQSCIDRFPDGDALPEALYRLGTACMDAGLDARGRQTLTRLIQEHPDNLWTEPAGERLRALPPVEMESRP